MFFLSVADATDLDFSLSSQSFAHAGHGGSRKCQIPFLSLELNVGNGGMIHTWWFIPLSKWVITLVIDGISGVSPLITRVITHLLNVMHKMKIDIDLEHCQF